ncbi:hypothetical protein BX070DRAFT_231827 [Coemansia spiralis]|nr:hypothetical protein BX070DRAFT_231827 [Coemansia spiralis]
MEYQGVVRGKRLSFKNSAKTTKQEKGAIESGKRSKRKHKRKHSHSQDHGNEEDDCKDHITTDGWVPVSSISDLEGPLVIYFRDDQLHVLSLPPKEEIQALADAEKRPPVFYALEGVSLMESEPSKVEQVFVGRKSVPNTSMADAQSKLYSFKSCRGTYLSANKHGDIECNSAAIGPLEMWTPIMVPDRGDGAVALMIHQPSNPNTDYFLSAKICGQTTKYNTAVVPVKCLR